MQARLLILLAAMAATSLFAEPVREPLWSGKAPGQKGDDPRKDVPAITVYPAPADNNSKTAIVVCPGGGYGGLAMGHEGKQIADWLNGLGITAAVLEYRMSRGGYRHPIPLTDAQRAIRTIRNRAAALGIGSDRIGILGFSAGGHLASTAGTHFDAGKADAEDPIERLSSRPDFMVLCYPVIAFDEAYTHRGSQRNLLGNDAPKELVDSLSNEKQVSAQTPPTFLFHTDEDSGVPPENSVHFYLALRQHKVPAELHVYRKGGHGVGLGKSIPGTAEWSNACAAWLRNLNMIPK